MPNQSIKPYYVILTGSKNNAGDYLIKYRAKQLFAVLRPDRDIVDIDGWKQFDEETLKIVNNSECLILMGGPALQEKMYPRVYGLTDSLDKITAPIVTMGIGWYSAKGTWEDTYKYSLSNKTIELLNRINESGYYSSVRDYHTLNVLNGRELQNFKMTGCPALYDLENFEQETPSNFEPKKIGFSLGVSMKDSARMYQQMQQAVEATTELFPKAELEVVFHHALGDAYLDTHAASANLHNAQIKYSKWLEVKGISYVDISGSAENLVEFYSTCDFHIGYRVHAHIFMSSISKPSVLLNEDGRGIGLRDVIGGVSLDAYDKCIKNKFITGLHTLGLPFDNYEPKAHFIDEYNRLLSYESSQGIRFSAPRKNINNHFHVMNEFLMQLP